jgi:ATP-dependent Lon protease
MDQVIQHALVRVPEAIEWEEVIPSKTAQSGSDEDSQGLIAH